MKRDMYFKELALVLGRGGFTTLPQENDSLPVEYQGRRLCRINDQSNVFYRQEEVNLPEREQALAKVTDMAGTVLEYMSHLEHAPTIQAMGLSEAYQSLAEFNGTVLAGWQTEKGAKFVTWDWDFNHTGLNHGHYYEGNYVGAKRDFAIRSGLIPDERQFTTEQLVEIYQQSACIRFSCSLPEEQERTIDTIQQRIQELVPDCEERMTHSNKSLYTNVSIKKTGYAEVMPGQSIRYDFSGIANNSTTSLTSFYWRDTLPTQAVRLDKIITGTYNVAGNYKVVYQTNLSGGTWRTMYDNLSTMQSYTLDASPAALGLASNEYVTQFMVSFGVVPANFRQVEAPRVYCNVVSWLTGGSQFVNQVDAGGVYDGQWIMATSRWVTRVYKPSEPLPKTGY